MENDNTNGAVYVLVILFFISLLYVSIQPDPQQKPPKQLRGDGQVYRFLSVEGFTITSSPVCTERECVQTIREIGGALPILELVTPSKNTRALSPPTGDR